MTTPRLAVSHLLAAFRQVVNNVSLPIDTGKTLTLPADAPVILRVEQLQVSFLLRCGRE